MREDRRYNSKKMLIKSIKYLLFIICLIFFITWKILGIESALISLLMFVIFASCFEIFSWMLAKIF